MSRERQGQIRYFQSLLLTAGAFLKPSAKWIIMETVKDLKELEEIKEKEEK